MINQITKYFKESYSEIKKVTWLSKKDTYDYTIIVIVASLVIAAFLGVFDLLFNYLLSNFIL